MSGLPDANFPAFNAAAAAWRAAGWEVENPAESFDGRADLAYTTYVEADVPMLRRCDAIAMLPGWDGPNARGSVWEREIAVQMLGLSMYDATQPAPPRARALLPTDAAARKAVPLATGVLDYFPAALAEVARVSKAGNDQHNPGQPLHWARGKSMDQADTLLRHLAERGSIDVDGMRHSAKLAWRALALLQLELEAEGAPLARGAREANKETT